jgi:hypothetical protein
VRRALAPVRWWIRLYTVGLPRGIRDERRAELESDLWEEWCRGVELGLGAVAVARSVWTRWLLGIPDDIAWRIELIRMRSRPAATSRVRLAGLTAGVVLAVALVLVVVIVNTIQYNEGTQPSGAAASILLFLALAVALTGIATAARGFMVMRSRRAEGVLLVVGGSIVAGLAWYWLILPVIAAVSVSLYGVWRACGLAGVMPRTSQRPAPGAPR